MTDSMSEHNPTKTTLDKDEIDRLRLLRKRARAKGAEQDFGFRNHETAAYVAALLHLAPALFDAAEASLSRE